MIMNMAAQQTFYKRSIGLNIVLKNGAVSLGHGLTAILKLW